jgi:hypothetical protein
MPYKITVETEVGSYDFHLTPVQATQWLATRQFAGIRREDTGVTTPLAQMDHDQVARALGVAFMAVVKNMVAGDGVLNLHNEPDDEPWSWVSVHARLVGAVKVRPPDDDENDGEGGDDAPEDAEPLSVFNEDDWLGRLQDGL